jgi:POT family proton-dependent oligopeptide transporter
MMGVWFLAAAVGNYLGGRVAGMYETVSLPALFGIVAGTTLVAGIVLALASPRVRRLMGGVR